MVYLSFRTALLLCLAAATSLAAPTTTTTTPMEGPTELELEATTPASEFPTGTAPAENEEAELVITTVAPADDETANTSAVEMGSTSGELYQTELESVETTTEVAPTATLTTESPYAPYDCSRTSGGEMAHDLASYERGIELVQDELQIALMGLVVASRDCDGYPLSALNSQLRTLNRPLDGVQPLANSVGKIEAYITLIQRTLRAEHNDGMQALQDVLRGVVQDLYLLLSPTYCTDCIDPSSTATCFDIPQLDTKVLHSGCNLVSYISLTVGFELRFIDILTQSWVSQQVEPESLPSIQDWLDTHVHEDSPAYEILVPSSSA